jgi:predicted HTH transcriptional regulator
MNREDIVLDRCRTVRNQNQAQLLVTANALDLLKTFQQQLDFITSIAQDGEIDAGEFPQIKTPLALRGKPGPKHVSAAARQQISNAQKKRWHEAKQQARAGKHTSRNQNGNSPRWSEKEDERLITFIREHGNVGLSDVSKALGRAMGRTPGAIHQRLYKMVAGKQLKRIGSHGPGTKAVVALAEAA